MVADSEGRALGGGLNPLERGGLSEAQPNLSSPMLLLADPERMTPLIQGLPYSLKPIGIQLQGRIQNTPSEERAAAALEGGATPDCQRPRRKVWTWGEIAQELINYGRKYGPVNRPYPRAETVTKGMKSVNHKHKPCC